MISDWAQQTYRLTDLQTYKPSHLTLFKRVPHLQCPKVMKVTSGSTPHRLRALLEPPEVIQSVSYDWPA
jgi:hypothetical protein